MKHAKLTVTANVTEVISALRTARILLNIYQPAHEICAREKAEYLLGRVMLGDLRTALAAELNSLDADQEPAVVEYLLDNPCALRAELDRLDD